MSTTIEEKGGVSEWVEDTGFIDGLDEKADRPDLAEQLLQDGHIEITRDELAHLTPMLPDMPAAKAKLIVERLYDALRHDTRQSPETLARMHLFISDPLVIANPKVYESLIFEMRVFALLSTTSSPYPEVRAVTSDKDDVDMPSLTIRVFVLGSLLSGIGCVINAIFALRYPGIYIGAGVIQLITYPFGVGWAKIVPNWKIFGLSLNPGPFNRKEHMLIYVMSVLGVSAPPLQHLIFVQAMPMYFGMEYAKKAGYMFLGSLGTNLIGFGFAGLTRRFLVYPSHCVWPGSLGTLAVNNSLHEKGGDKTAIPGPFGTWRASMFKVFGIVWVTYFLYYFLPTTIFPNLTIFDWMAWIKPSSGKLVAVTSGAWAVGLGFNPLPTFDYAYLTQPGGFYPTVIQVNYFLGITIGMLVALILWLRNSHNSGYFPVNATSSYDNTGATYNVTKVVDHHGVLLEDQYQTYSAPYMAASTIVATTGTFMFTAATLTQTLLYNRSEVSRGFRGFYRDIKSWFLIRMGRTDEVQVATEDEMVADDIHRRIMRNYKEVPEWWFACVLLFAAVCSFICLGVYTPLNPAIVLFAPLLTLIFIVPIGIVASILGNQPSLNTLSELLGGLIFPGNTMAVQYVRMFGSEPVWHALIYCNDLKLGQYAHIPPRHMFICQMWGAVIGTIVTVAQWTWLMGLKDICTDKAPFRLICPDAQTNFTAALFWGTLGVRRMFGAGSRYKWLLMGFPVGVLFPVVFFLLKRRFPSSRFLQKTHPLLITLAIGYSNGGHWGQYFPGVVINWLSWDYVRTHYLAWWQRYNYVILAALAASYPFTSLINFFAFSYTGVAMPQWWGTTGGTPGCIGGWNNADCAPFKINQTVGYFGPPPGQIPM